MRLLRRRRPEHAPDPLPSIEGNPFETPEQLLTRIDLRVLRRLDGLLQGAHRTLAYGSGLDFADLRKYTVDDDVRHIDWNVTARLDEPYVRTFHEDREVTAWLLVDRTGSMAFGPSGRSKSAATAEFVTAMARLLSRQGNRVGAMLYDLDVERIIEPSIGRRHVLHLARETMRPVHGSRRGGPGTDLGGLVEAALIRIRRRSLVVLVSDFHSTPGWHDRLGVLSRRHDVIAVRVTDPTEHLLPDAGLVPITDAETGEQIIVDTTDPAFRRRFAEVAAVHERELTRAMRAAGVDMFTLSTQGDVVDTLVHMARSRRRRR